MDRDEEKTKTGQSTAIKAFGDNCQKCKSDDELAGFVTMMATLCIKTIHGMEGRQFKEDFLRGAIADKEKITPMRVQ